MTKTNFGVRFTHPRHVVTKTEVHILLLGLPDLVRPSQFAYIVCKPNMY
jgi:hypothetical protein